MALRWVRLAVATAITYNDNRCPRSRTMVDSTFAAEAPSNLRMRTTRTCTSKPAAYYNQDFLSSFTLSNSVNSDINDLGFPATPVPLYSVAKQPAIRAVRIADVIRLLELPKFLQHLREHPFFANLPVEIDPNTSINVWSLLRVTVPASLYCPTERTYPLYAHSGLDDQKGRRWDSIFYLPTHAPSVRTPDLEVLHGKPKSHGRQRSVSTNI
jgi:hypothetical protein